MQLKNKVAIVINRYEAAIARNKAKMVRKAR